MGSLQQYFDSSAESESCVEKGDEDRFQFQSFAWDNLVTLSKGRERQ